MANSAQQFISAMANYTGDDFYNDVAYDLGINEDATEASFGGADTTMIIFDDNSAVWFHEADNKTWKERTMSDLVLGFQIVDGVERSDVYYVQANNGTPDEEKVREICEDYANLYDHNGGEDFVVCRTADIDANDYTFPNFKFAFDADGGFEWKTDRQYTTA